MGERETRSMGRGGEKERKRREESVCISLRQ